MQIYQESLQKIDRGHAVTRIFAALACAFLFGLHPILASDLVSAMEPPQGSFNYSLVGVARFDGISYASLIDRQTKEHFLLSTEKAENGLTLTSITSDWSASGASAVIQQDGRLIILKLGSNERGAVSDTPSPQTVPLANSFPMPDLATPDHPTPPPGASLPLVFQSVDTKALNLSEEQQAIINRLRQDFSSAVDEKSPNNSNSTANSQNTNGQNITDAQQLKNWRKAQMQSDNLFRMLFGTQAFNSYQMAVSP